MIGRFTVANGSTFTITSVKPGSHDSQKPSVRKAKDAKGVGGQKVYYYLHK